MDLLRKVGEFDDLRRGTRRCNSDGLQRRCGGSGPLGSRQTSGRTQREIAGSGNWAIDAGPLDPGGAGINAVDPAAAESDVTAELKRLLENEILRQERDILKKATARPGGEVDEVHAHRWGQRHSPSIAFVACLVSAKAVILPGEVGWPATANATTWCCWRMSVSRCLVGQHLWQSPNDVELRDILSVVAESPG